MFFQLRSTHACASPPPVYRHLGALSNILLAPSPSTFRPAQWQQLYGLTGKSCLQPSGLESDLLWDYMMVSMHVGRARCGGSLMQGWGGRRSGRATHACPFRLPLSAVSLPLGWGGTEKLAHCRTRAPLEKAAFGHVLEEPSTLPLMSRSGFCFCQSSD